MSPRIFNFSAGPAVMPESVLHKTAAALLDLEGSGIGVAEHSHRGVEIMGVFARAEARLRELMGIPADYAVMFLQGGASTQFFMLPANFLGKAQTADYLHTGAWTKKAIAEARRYGNVHVAASSEAGGFDHIPDDVSYSAAPAYVHVCSNNTIFGTQWHTAPTPPAGVPLICDASSDILSRPVDVSKYAVIYGGAQKNLGPSGLTLVIMRRDLVEAGSRDLPTMLQYRTHADNESMFNTPPTLSVYVLAEVLEWVAAEGGLTAMAERNQAKAGLLYRTIDDSSFYSGTVRTDSRSLMNVCFRTPSAELDAAFCKESTAAGLAYLKGHRSVGGMRASLYNAMPLAGVEALVAFMREFERTRG